MPWYGDQASRAISRAAAVGLNRAAEYLLHESQALTPEDTGGLEESARVHKATQNEPASQVQFLKYTAVWQHEKLNYKHKKGQAKFLSGPLRAKARNLVDIVAQAIRTGLG